MPSLEASSSLGESLLQTDQGSDFRGTIFSLKDNQVPSYDYTNPRTYLRVSPDSFISTGMLILDAFGRRFLTAYHDLSQQANTKLYKTYRLFYMTTNASWTRVVTSIDTLTGLPKNSGGAPTNLGPVWCSIEMINREEIDLTFRVKEQSMRVITNAALQLNDKIEEMLVKRVDHALGVTIAEIQ